MGLKKRKEDANLPNENKGLIRPAFDLLLRAQVWEICQGNGKNPRKSLDLGGIK